MSTKTTQQSRITGVRACISALRTLCRSAETNMRSDTTREHFKNRESDAMQFATSLGPVSPHIEGALIALAEYINMSIQAGRPELDEGGWVPFLLMTKGEREAEIAEIDADALT